MNEKTFFLKGKKEEPISSLEFYKILGVINRLHYITSLISDETDGIKNPDVLKKISDRIKLNKEKNRDVNLIGYRPFGYITYPKFDEKLMINKIKKESPLFIEFFSTVVSTTALIIEIIKLIKEYKNKPYSYEAKKKNNEEINGSLEKLIISKKNSNEQKEVLIELIKSLVQIIEDIIKNDDIDLDDKE
ncbi:MAG: hypothetical protein KA792_02175 [Bacteroidales bacterium]|nr:hypothetical protein [Bacteroidales bacterium]